MTFKFFIIFFLQLFLSIAVLAALPKQHTSDSRKKTSSKATEVIHFNSIREFKQAVDSKSDIQGERSNDLMLLNLILEGRGLQDIEVFIDKGADVNMRVKGQTLLHWMAILNDYKIADLLIRRGADIHARNANKETPMDMAVKYDNVKVAELFIDRGVDIETTDQHGRTLLYKAARYGSVQVADLFIERGADTRAGNNKGMSPFHAAVINDHLEIVKRFSDKDIIHINTNRNSTFMHFAAKYDSIKVARFLADHGVDIHAQNKDGFTALHVAAAFGSIKVARLLVRGGADIQVKNKNGSTPLYLARLHGVLNAIDTGSKQGVDVAEFLSREDAKKSKRNTRSVALVKTHSQRKQVSQKRRVNKSKTQQKRRPSKKRKCSSSFVGT